MNFNLEGCRCSSAWRRPITFNFQLDWMCHNRTNFKFQTEKCSFFSQLTGNQFRDEFCVEIQTSRGPLSMLEVHRWFSNDISNFSLLSITFEFSCEFSFLTRITTFIVFFQFSVHCPQCHSTLATFNCSPTSSPLCKSRSAAASFQSQLELG